MKKIDKLESELKELKELLFNNPEISLKIPLLKRDVDSIREDNRLLREEMARMYDTTKWMMGITITISLGLLALAISVLLTG